jgi:hypothetical protein
VPTNSNFVSFALLIAAAVIIQQQLVPVDTGDTGMRAANRKQESEWQIQQSSGTHTEFRQCSLVQKLVGMMLLLFLSGSGTRSAECDGPNGTHFPLGLAPVPLGQPNINVPETTSSYNVVARSSSSTGLRLSI